MNEISREELIKVITDFIEMGHVENIIAMFKEDPSYYELTGDLLRDERFMVRIGVAVLFEELVTAKPEDVGRAVSSLKPLLKEETPFVRGEAVNILGIIGSKEALSLVAPMADDPDPQVAEIARDFLAENL